MSDRSFEVSMVLVAVVVLAGIVVASVLAALGYIWLDMAVGLGIFLNILIGLVVLILAGGTLLHFWGKTYMSRG